jgi:hypothetical protein
MLVEVSVEKVVEANVVTPVKVEVPVTVRPVEVIPRKLKLPVASEIGMYVDDEAVDVAATPSR